MAAHGFLHELIASLLHGLAEKWVILWSSSVWIGRGTRKGCRVVGNTACCGGGTRGAGHRGLLFRCHMLCRSRSRTWALFCLDLGGRNPRSVGIWMVKPNNSEHRSASIEVRLAHDFLEWNEHLFKRNPLGIWNKYLRVRVWYVTLSLNAENVVCLMSVVVI